MNECEKLHAAKDFKMLRYRDCYWMDKKDVCSVSVVKGKFYFQFNHDENRRVEVEPEYILDFCTSLNIEYDTVLDQIERTK